MIVEALLISLILSISLFLFEFFKMRTIFENTFRYNNFFSGIGTGRMRFLDTPEQKKKDMTSKFSEIEKRFYGMEDRLSKQESILERIIKEISGINA